ncbi:reverse transcriptase [Tanacetum coccineum]
MTKVDFPKFLEDDVKKWIFKCEQFFSIDDIHENQKVKLISIHLFDTPLLWHKQFIKLDGENTNAKDYQDAFDTLLSREDISEEHAVSFYLGGLPVEIEIRVRMFKPKTLVDAYSFTNFQEATLEAVRKKNKTAMTSSVEEEKEYFEVEEGDEVMPMQEELPQISLNALNGSNTFQTMRVIGKVGKHELHILVECGSTHNFLDDSVAKRIRCQWKKTCPLTVKLGEGKQLISDSECKGFVWQLQGETFEADMMILPLGGYEMWMEGKHQENEVEGIPHAELLMLSVFPNTGLQLMSMQEGPKIVPIGLQKVVDQYSDVFVIPKELPPHRSYDHRNPLIEGTHLVNIRPYRHPRTQKDAIETMVKELWKHGHLNKNTVKDKFPIPIIEELIDELHGATIFSKLDLRSGYHQIRMCGEDVAKTALMKAIMNF